MSSAGKSGRGSFPSISGADRFWLSLVNRESGSEPDRARHRELADLLDLVGDLIEAYESADVEIPDAEPPAVLRLLMEQHGLKQQDLPDIAPQSVISEILAGKRRINARQAKALAGRFGVSAAVFL